MIRAALLAFIVLYMLAAWLMNDVPLDLLP